MNDDSIDNLLTLISKNKKKLLNCYKPKNSEKLYSSFYVFTSLRQIHKKKKENNSIRNLFNNSMRDNRLAISIDKDYLLSSNDTSFANSNYLKYNASNISSYQHLNNTINLSRNYNNNINETFSTSPSYIEKRTVNNLIESNGKKFMKKRNYGKLLLFNGIIREERYENYKNKFLSIEINKEKENVENKKSEYDYTIFNHQKTEKYLNKYMEDFKSCVRNYKSIYNREAFNFEKLLLKENSLTQEIDRLNKKKKKLLEKLLNYIEIKKFLLQVKNKTLETNKFKLEDFKEIEKDEKKRELALNDYIKKNTIKRYSMNVNKSMNNTLIKKKYFISQYTKHFPEKKISAETINEETIEKVNKPIFENVDSFFTVYDILNDELSKYLVDFNTIRKDIRNERIVLQKLQKDFEIYEKEREKRNYEQIRNYLKQKEILKERNKELIQEKNYLLKKFPINQKTKNLIKSLEDHIFNIFKNINKYFKKFIINEELLHGKNITIVRLEIIENLVDQLMNEKKYFILNLPNEYKQFRLTKNLKDKLEHIENRKKEDMEKQRKLIQKIYENTNKIIIIPKHKVYEKINFQNEQNK